MYKYLIFPYNMYKTSKVCVFLIVLEKFHLTFFCKNDKIEYINRRCEILVKTKVKKRIILKSFATLFYTLGVVCICAGIVGVNSLKAKSFESVEAYNNNLNKSVSTKELMTSYQNLSKAAEKRAIVQKAKKIASEESSANGGATYPKSECKAYAYTLVVGSYGWSENDYNALVKLWNRESGWRATAHASSGAHGIPQALPASKMASEGSDYYTNCKPQIRWGLKYIKGKYGSPSNAWSYFQSRGWY